jgi:hypothetical protein
MYGGTVFIKKGRSKNGRPTMLPITEIAAVRSQTLKLDSDQRHLRKE